MIRGEKIYITPFESELSYPRFCAHRGFSAAIEKAHAHGIRCNLFYSDDAEDAKLFWNMGVDTILTNELLIVQPTKKAE